MNYTELHKASMTQGQAVALFDFLIEIGVSAMMFQGETEDDGKLSGRWGVNVVGSQNAIWDFPVDAIEKIARGMNLKTGKEWHDEEYLASAILMGSPDD